MRGAKAWLDTGDYIHLGYDTPDAVYEKREDFWKHYEVVTDSKVPDHQATFFSCAC